MFSESTKAKLEFLLKIISDIEYIINKHDGVAQALEDIEGHHAIMMCMLQIGETLPKIKEEELSEILPIKLAYKMRNIIAHDYAGVNPNIIISTVETDVPKVKKAICDLLSQNS